MTVCARAHGGSIAIGPLKPPPYKLIPSRRRKTPFFAVPRVSAPARDTTGPVRRRRKCDPSNTIYLPRKTVWSPSRPSISTSRRRKRRFSPARAFVHRSATAPDRLIGEASATPLGASIKLAKPFDRSPDLRFRRPEAENAEKRRFRRRRARARRSATAPYRSIGIQSATPLTPSTRLGKTSGVNTGLRFRRPGPETDDFPFPASIPAFRRRTRPPRPSASFFRRDRPRPRDRPRRRLPTAARRQDRRCE